MRVFIASLIHETNVFSPIVTDMNSYKEGFYYDPKEDSKKEKIADTLYFGDLFRWVRDRGHEVVVGLGAGAQPSGPTSKELYEKLRDRIIQDLKDAGKVDFVALYLHGAQVADGYMDCEGDLLQRIREVVGESVPVGALLDLHGNIGPAMLENATCLVACKEYPHVDYESRAHEMLGILEQAASGKITPKMSAAYVPIIGNFHTTREPLRGFVDRVIAMETGDILSISMMHGFSFSDTPDVGGNIIVVTNDKQEDGAQVAKALAKEFMEVCQAVSDGYWVDCDTAIDMATSNTDSSGPVVIADFADNPGGGAAGDSTFILEALLNRKVSNSAVGMIWDPETADQCRQAGVGAKLKLCIGGKASERSGHPIEAITEVLCINEEIVPEHMSVKDLRVALDVEGVSVVVNSIRDQVFSPDAFSSVGIDVLEKEVVVVKSAQHFHENFSPIASSIVYCDTPGSLSSKARQLSYRKISRPIWPLDNNACVAVENELEDNVR